MALPYSQMDPQLDEGIFNASDQTIIGGNFIIQCLFPEISEQSPNASITANTVHSLFVTISDLEGIEAVWAVVVPPDYVAPEISPDLQSPEVVLPTIPLSDPNRDGRFDTQYSDFPYNGIYRVTFYARNETGHVTVSPATIITVTGGQNIVDVDPGDVNGDGVLNLADAIKALQVVSGLCSDPCYVHTAADVDGDGRIGLAELLYVLRELSE